MGMEMPACGMECVPILKELEIASLYPPPSLSGAPLQEMRLAYIFHIHHVLAIAVGCFDCND